MLLQHIVPKCDFISKKRQSSVAYSGSAPRSNARKSSPEGSDLIFCANVSVLFVLRNKQYFHTATEYIASFLLLFVDCNV